MIVRYVNYVLTYLMNNISIRNSYMNNKKEVQLFLTFLKIGAFTFGGGYAMIPLIQREMVENKKWINDKDISDIIAIAETTPGPIAINAATFVGYKISGIKGAIVATMGVMLPSFFIILLIAQIFRKYMDYEIVKNAFWGVRIAVIALMLKALATMFKQCPKNVVSYSIAIISFVLVGIVNVNALYIIVAAAFIGFIYKQIKAGDKL